MYSLSLKLIKYTLNYKLLYSIINLLIIQYFVVSTYLLKDQKNFALKMYKFKICINIIKVKKRGFKYSKHLIVLRYDPLSKNVVPP